MDVRYQRPLRVTPSRKDLLKIKPKRNHHSKTKVNKLFIGDGGSTDHFINCIIKLMIQARKLNPNLINAKQIRASVITK